MMHRCPLYRITALGVCLGFSAPAKSVPVITPELNAEMVAAMGHLRPMLPVPSEEETAWVESMQRFAQRQERDDFSAPLGFLAEHPHSMWGVPLRIRLAEELYLTGHYTGALNMLGSVWEERHEGSVPGVGWLYARAGVRLTELYARLGRVEQVEQVLGALQDLPLDPTETEIIRSVEQGLATMREHPERAFRCGALALERLRVHQDSTRAGHPAVLSSRSSTQGMSLADVASLAQQLGMDYQLAFRDRGAPLLTPCVLHLRVGHFVAVLGQSAGKARVEDPTGWQTTFASMAALDEESSGYCLVPTGELPSGWRPVGDAEAATVYGRNGVLDNDPDGAGRRDKRSSCGGEGGRSAFDGPVSYGMASYDVHLMLVSQQILDTPLGYEPPYGPPIYVTLRHTQRSNERFGYRPEWTMNWSGQIYEEPLTPLGDLWVHEEGGWERFVSLNDDGTVYQGPVFNAGRLVRTSASTIDWVFPDGTRRIYTTAAPANVVWGRVFQLTGVEDAAGNRVAIQVLPNGRVESITDPLGRVTRFYYELTDPGLPQTSDPSVFPVLPNIDYTNQVTRIVDPFGRTATFGYLKVERTRGGYCGGDPCLFAYYNYDLTNITDVAGLSSQFQYGWSGTVVTNLTTPYGTTMFRWESPFAGSYALEITDPEGATERIQFGMIGDAGDPLWRLPDGMLAESGYLTSGRTVAHWRKKAFAESYQPGSTTGATLYTFQLGETFAAAGRVLEAIKPPLDGRIWFNYPGQGSPVLPGIGNLPTRIGRVLDDGSTQLWQYDRDAWGNIVRSVDPVGRTISYSYATNGIDLLEVRQTREGQNERLLTVTYDNRHLPLTVTDAAGQTSRYTYNARGQLTRFVNALAEPTDVAYDTQGFLTSVDGPLPGTQDRTTYTYDAVGRLATVTDDDGYRVSLGYDALDRVLTVTFPDGTRDEIGYARLDVASFRDRLGRVTQYRYDGLGRLTSVLDALGRETRLQWCGCGALEALIDPLGRMTRWDYDLQGRVVAKEYADGSRTTCEYEHLGGRLLRVRDEQGQVKEFAYAADDALVAKRYRNALRQTPEVGFTYDRYYPRLVTMTDGQGTTTYRYHPVRGTPALGALQLAAVDGPWSNDETTYTYDALGRLVDRSINGVKQHHAYDSAGRLITLTNALGAFTYSWDAGSDRLAALAYPNGLRAEFTYFGSQRDHLLQRIRNVLPGGSTLSEFDYQYNALGRITNWAQLQNGAQKSWVASYDAIDRLTTVIERPVGGPDHVSTFGFDAANNRTLAQVDAANRLFQVNTLNQLTAVTDDAAPPSTLLEWDAEGRLVAATRGSHRSEFGYDGLDRRTRVVERDNGVVVQERRYLWCGSLLCEERDSTGGVVRQRYSSHGTRAESGADLPAGNYYFTRDHLLSVREMVDGTGVVRAAYTYTPFGEPTRLTGDLDSDFGFTGHLVHHPTGYLLGLYRPYDPQLGRWLTRDPLGEGGGMNLYAYVRNDPLNGVDLDGLEPRAAPLVNQTSGYKQAQQGVKAYENAKKVSEVVESAVEKGIKKTAQEKVKGKLEDEAKKAFPKGAQEEAEKLNEEAGKTGREAVDPYGKTVFGKAGIGITDALAGDCPTPKANPRPRTKKSPPPEKSLLDKIFDFFGSESEDPPKPPEPDGKIPPEKLRPQFKQYDWRAAQAI